MSKINSGLYLLLGILIASIGFSLYIGPVLANSSTATIIGGATNGNIFGSIQYDEMNVTDTGVMRIDTGGGPILITYGYGAVTNTIGYNASIQHNFAGGNVVNVGAAGNDFGATNTLVATTFTTLTDSALTSGRVVIAGVAGLLADDADFTFSGDTLTITKIGGTIFTATLNVWDDISFGVDAKSINTPNADNNYVMFKARDNGVGLVEIGRLVSAADPHFSFGTTQQVKIFNNGNITSTLLAGAGNDYVCVDAAGVLFRQNAAC